MPSTYEQRLEMFRRLAVVEAAIDFAEWALEQFERPPEPGWTPALLLTTLTLQALDDVASIATQMSLDDGFEARFLREKADRILARANTIDISDVPN